MTDGAVPAGAPAAGAELVVPRRRARRWHRRRRPVRVRLPRRQPRQPRPPRRRRRNGAAARPPLPPKWRSTKEPIYEGEPILAVAADSEELAAAAIEANHRRLRAAAVRRSIRSTACARAARTDVPKATCSSAPTVEDDEVDGRRHARRSARASSRRTPKPARRWSVGDVDKGFKEADLVVETRSHQQTTVAPAARVADGDGVLAERQAVSARLDAERGAHRRLGRRLGRHPARRISCSSASTRGGGFGSKIPGAQSMAIPALLSKKLNGRPVMMRISREEETYIGRTRPGFQAWIKMGFKKDGRVTAIDAFIVEDSGPYRAPGRHATSANLASLLYQAPNMRFRGLSVATNTPPRVSQRAPGGLQASVLFEPLDQQGRASKLGVDQVAIRKINAPARGRRSSASNPVRAGRTAAHARSPAAIVKEALDQGRRDVQLGRAQEAERPAQRHQGAPAWPSATALTPPARSASTACASSSPTASSYIHQGIGNLGTHSVIDTARVIAEVARHAVGQVRGGLGQHRASGVAWSSIQAGSQTTYAHTRANYAAGQAPSSGSCRSWRRRSWADRRTSYDVGGERVFRKGGGRAMTLAQAAERAIKRGGKFDGHEAAEGNQRDDQGLGARAGRPGPDGRGARQPAA